ncbi:BPTI/Kunitz inhibitor domain-containing protein, partial [Trichostrongylus colubriformis]
MWYFDISEGTCKQFTYSGCRGNDNRFETKESCERRCIDGSNNAVMLGDEAADANVGIKLYANPHQPYLVGDKVELNCDTRGVLPVVWMKDGALLHHSKRIQVHNQFSKVTISNVTQSDSGEYRCAVGPDGLLSDAYVVKVI